MNVYLLLQFNLTYEYIGVIVRSEFSRKQLKNTYYSKFKLIGIKYHVSNKLRSFMKS